MMRRLALSLLPLLLTACAGTVGDGPPTSARGAQARFDSACAARPDRATIEKALLDISDERGIEPVAPRDFVDRLAWHLRPPPPGAASALKGGGKRFAGSGLPLFGDSFVAAVVYLDGDGRVLGCRSSILHDGP